MEDGGGQYYCSTSVFFILFDFIFKNLAILWFSSFLGKQQCNSASVRNHTQLFSPRMDDKRECRSMQRLWEDVFDLLYTICIALSAPNIFRMLMVSRSLPFFVPLSIHSLLIGFMPSREAVRQCLRYPKTMDKIGYSAIQRMVAILMICMKSCNHIKTGQEKRTGKRNS